MHFVPAGEIIGDRHQVRSVKIAGDPNLPSGEYTFVDHYCTDSKCDCRKTMIHVLYKKELVSVVNFGWESPEFYCEWMGMGSHDDIAAEMSGVSIDLYSPDKVSNKGILILINHLLDETWREILIGHYNQVRAGLKKPRWIPAKAAGRGKLRRKKRK